MTKHHPKNERIKHEYFSYLKEAHGSSEATVDAVAKALDRFEVDTKHRDFRLFHPDQATAFKRPLAEQRSQKSQETLSKATLYSTLMHLKRFFLWLPGRPGYRSLRYTDADYFNLSDKDTRIATARRERAGPTLEQVKHVISIMPTDSEIERRDRALIAFRLGNWASLNGEDGEPKGMHWRAFECLTAEHDAFVSESLAGMAKGFGFLKATPDGVKV